MLKQESVYVGESDQSMDLYLMYWDPVNDHIATIYLDNHGTVIHEKVDSITDEGGTVTIVSSHEGSRYGGLTEHPDDPGGDRQDADQLLPGHVPGRHRHGLSWSEEPSVSTRVKD